MAINYYYYYNVCLKGYIVHILAIAVYYSILP